MRLFILFHMFLIVYFYYSINIRFIPWNYKEIIALLNNLSCKLYCIIQKEKRKQINHFLNMSDLTIYTTFLEGTEDAANQSVRNGFVLSF